MGQLPMFDKTDVETDKLKVMHLDVLFVDAFTRQPYHRHRKTCRPDNGEYGMQITAAEIWIITRKT